MRKILTCFLALLLAAMLAFTAGMAVLQAPSGEPTTPFVWGMMPIQAVASTIPVVALVITAALWLGIVASNKLSLLIGTGRLLVGREDLILIFRCLAKRLTCNSPAVVWRGWRLPMIKPIATI
jgi:ABC-type proline/glycine betaine transport system permease subunit